MKTSVKHARKEKPLNLKHYVNWFEIPAYNFQRAVSFYNQIYAITMDTTEINNYAMAFFPAKGGVSGAVVAGEGCVPNTTGPLLYLNGGKDLNVVLSRIEAAGGRIIMNKTLINEAVGHFALFMDTEGNRLALHSKN
ncbi:MAG: VOC family protein [Flammeovirgaceae bacterium]|nr:VOC family protein [Flammeovirgaceae bacterium]